MVAVVGVLSTLSWTPDGGAAKSGKGVAITGTLSCAACKLGGSAQHKCSKECCKGCIKGGDSVLLEDAKGNLYLLVSKEKEKPVLSGEQLEVLGEKVVVKGTMVEKGGLKGIYVDSIEGGMKKLPVKQKEETKEH